MKISAVLQLLVFLAFMQQTAQSLSSSSSSGSLCHVINSDDQCMNAPVTELIEYRRKLDNVPDIGVAHHKALQGVITQEPTCGIILLEKSQFEGECPYGNSRAVPWDELSLDIKKTFYQSGRVSADNVYKRTPEDLMIAMGPEYDVGFDNCQDAIVKAWESWDGYPRKIRVDNSKKAYDYSKIDCPPIYWESSAEQYKISPFLLAIPAWSIVKVLLW